MKLSNKSNRKGCRLNRCPQLLIVLLLTLIIFIIHLTLPVYSAVKIFSDFNTTKYFIVKENSELYIDYIHSVMKTPVRDVFEVKKNNTLLLVRTEYSSFGAGLPTENYGTIQLVDGVYINRGINKELTIIPLRVGAIANHKVQLEDGRFIFLKDFINVGSLVKIKAVKISRLQAFFIEGRNRIGG
ncbi:DUF1850 domain-containing protein [Alkaliphilus pronyensis]|uniref:DUF1850 domain-containing protein n=1 Tax=Alkaliphilus pronyensis TaxID=1482732 RepID=A0A6I0F6D5_9FIRM|nr:DUF1850 domain-containing protein [Alkaliphilus pronyensis]KAB3532755.1 DUF1850 domain-containing protein [Alkaliphilus pronyensis]